MFTDLLADRFAAWQARCKDAQAEHTGPVILPPPAPARPRPRQWQAFGFALGVFAAAISNPVTGRIALQQAALCDPGAGLRAVYVTATFGHLTPDRAARHTRLAAAVARYAADVGVQTANAMLAADATLPGSPDLPEPMLTLWGGMPDDKIAGRQCLRRVMDRFPNSPVPCAAYLADAVGNHPLSSRQSLAWYREAIEKGERLDPDNAFFTCMRLNADFKSGDEAAALRDLDLASQKPRWDDYGRPIMQGIWQLNDAYVGMSNSQTHLAVLEAVRMHIYGRPMSFADGLTLLAWRYEESGNAPVAVAIRGRLMRLAQKMPGQMAGIIVQQAGRNLIARLCFQNRKLRDFSGRIIYDARVPDYPDYLLRHGYPAEEQWVQRQLEVTPAADTVFLTSWTPRAKEFVNPLRLAAGPRPYWIAGVGGWVLLALGVIAGCIAALLNFRKRFGAGRPRALSGPAQTGIGIGLLLAVCTLYGLHVGVTGSVAQGLDKLPLLCLICLPAVVLGLMRETRVTGRAALGTYALVCGSVIGVFLPLSGAVVTASAMLNPRFAELGMEYTHLHSTLDSAFTLTAWLLALPLALGAALTAAGRLKHHPTAWAVWRGLTAVWLPILSLLLVGSAGLLLITARTESQADQIILQTMNSENQVSQAFMREARQNARQTPLRRILRALSGDLYALDAVQPLPSSQRR